MSLNRLIIGTDNIVELDGFQDQTDSSYINDATVTVTLYDDSGDEVSGETWPLTMNYVTSSDGTYRATLVDTLSLSVNKRYRAVVSADGGAGKKRTYRIDCLAVNG